MKKRKITNNNNTQPYVGFWQEVVDDLKESCVNSDDAPLNKLRQEARGNIQDKIAQIENVEEQAKKLTKQ